MNCPYCGAALAQGQTVCGSCGNPIQQAAPVQNTAPTAQVAPNYTAMPMPPQASGYSPEYKPLSPWAYIGYSILFSIPLVGIILLIVYAFDKTKINRRNFARSILLVMLFGILISVIIGIIVAVLGISLSDLPYQYSSF